MALRIEILYVYPVLGYLTDTTWQDLKVLMLSFSGLPWKHITFTSKCCLIHISTECVVLLPAPCMLAPGCLALQDRRAERDTRHRSERRSHSVHHPRRSRTHPRWPKPNPSPEDHKKVRFLIKLQNIRMIYTYYKIWQGRYVLSHHKATDLYYNII